MAEVVFTKHFRDAQSESSGPYAFWTVRYTPTEEEKAAAIDAAKAFLADVDQAMKDLLQ